MSTDFDFSNIAVTSQQSAPVRAQASTPVSSGESVTMISKACLVLTVPAAGLLGMFLLSAGESASGSMFIGVAMGLALQAVVIWPFYNIADDIHVLRKIAESNQ